MEEPDLILTADGSHTLYVRELNESYHSVNGALSESEHVYLQNGYHFLGRLENITVVEIGFGTGLNCLLTALEAERMKTPTLYYAFEKFPLPGKVLDSLNYPHICGNEGAGLFRKIHEIPWEKRVEISPWFALRKIRKDVLVDPMDEMEEVNLVYFDAFGPDKQPEIWSQELFLKIFRRMQAPGVFVTYSAKGSVRRNLEKAGFVVERLPGAAGKREMLRGIKTK